LPKAFISYSWTSTDYQNRIVDYAKRLIDDGVDVVMDVFDLKEGDDKYTYMERMVNDLKVTHVLMFCDAAYVKKANDRKAGVGTESQIMSAELYGHVTQSKFVAVLCEKGEDDKTSVPTFYGGRIYIDFSSPEVVNANWEQLLRHLHGRPLHTKPPLGNMPSYLAAESAPHNPATGKWRSLKQSILDGKSNVSALRNDFIEACLTYLDDMRPRVLPAEPNAGQFAYTQYQKMKPVRDMIADWVLVEGATTSSDFSEAYIRLLEGLLALSERPEEVNSYSEYWFTGHRLFNYECFLYSLAALVKVNALATLHDVLTSHYVTPSHGRLNGGFVTFEQFYERGEIVQTVLSSDKREFYFPAAELVRRNADRRDLPFSALNEADALAFVVAVISPDVRWYPGTLAYHQHGALPFFQRAAQHKGFAKLATVTGVSDAATLKSRVREGIKSKGHFASEGGWRVGQSLNSAWQIDKWDTIK
jgi:hypothetical protein